MKFICADYRYGDCACPHPCSVAVNVDVAGFDDRHQTAIAEELLSVLEDLGWEADLEADLDGPAVLPGDGAVPPSR